MNQQQAKENIDKVISIIAYTTSQEEDTLMDYVYAIILMALSKARNSRFTFSENTQLDNAVNKKLVELSDAIKDIIDQNIDSVIKLATDGEIDNIERDDIIAYVNRNIDSKGILDRLDSYHSELKYILEAYIASGIYEKLSAIEIAQEYKMWKDNPFAAPIVRNAMKHRFDFSTPFILSLGFSLGSGHYKSTTANYKRLSSYSIAEAYNYTTLQYIRKEPNVIGYKTFRNSNYPCAVCDDLTSSIHPLDSLVVPAHPNCVCGIVPVYISNDENFTHHKSYPNGAVYIANDIKKSYGLR